MIKVIDRPSIVLKNIEFDFSENNSSSKIKEVSNDIGRTPLVKIGGQIIEGKSTLSLNLYNDQFLPRIFISFKDSSGNLLDALFPLDNSVISVFIQSSVDNLMPIRMDFKITRFNPIKSKSGDNNDVIIECEGILNVDNLYNSPFLSFDDTSYNILKSLSKESKLGFSSNIDETNDKMVWINPADQILLFIQNVVKFSFKSIDTFLYAYVDFYYNLNYIDIETALNEDIKEQKGYTQSKFFTNDETDKNKLEEIEDLVLLNHPENINSSLYINKYNISNTSLGVNLDIGYLYFSSYYDIHGNTLYNLKLDTITSPGPDGNNIIMKGNIGEVSEIQNISIVNDYDGKIDTDNVHQHFLYAYQTNERNLKYLQKIKMKITITSANFNLYRFQKVMVRLYRINAFNKNEEKEAEYRDPVSTSPSDNIIKDEDKMNQRLSGEWLITSINYLYGANGVFEQEVTLVRRELTFNNNDFNPNKTY